MSIVQPITLKIDGEDVVLEKLEFLSFDLR